MLRLQKSLRDGDFFAVCWDNLVLNVHKQEETDMNRSKLLHCTTSFVHILNIPEPQKDAPPNDFQTYQNIIAAREENRRTGAVGLPRSLIYRDAPEYDILSPLDFLCSDTVQETWPQIIEAHIADICFEFFGTEVMTSFRHEGPSGKTKVQRPSIPEGLYRVPMQGRSQIQPLQVFEIDESTIDGNARIIDSILREISVKPEQLTDSVIFMTGDQMTTTRIRTLCELRVRDKLEQRMRFAAPVSGWLHIQMALADGILRCHAGRPDGQDPGSLNRFATLLGRTGVTGNVTDFNSLHRLILHALKAHVLASLLHMANEIERAKEAIAASTASASGLSDLADLKKWLRKNDWGELVRKTTDYY